MFTVHAAIAKQLLLSVLPVQCTHSCLVEEIAESQTRDQWAHPHRGEIFVLRQRSYNRENLDFCSMQTRDQCNEHVRIKGKIYVLQQRKPRSLLNANTRSMQ